MVGVARFVMAALMLAALVPGDAEADRAKYRLRIATLAPEGTSWANTFQKYAREIAKATNGDVEVRFYFGGIAGDELEVYGLLQADKLDGSVSGGPLCSKVAPSMRALDIVGLFQTQEEAIHVLTELRPTLEKEAHDAGYALVATGSLGPRIVFSREPVTSMAELRKTTLWSWSLHEVFHKEAAEMKLSVVGTSPPQAQKAFDEKRVEGFITTPLTALAFQWAVSTKYITDIRVGYLMGCMMMRERALDALPPEYQTIVRRASTKLGVKIDADNRRMDQRLLTTVYPKRGLQLVPVSAKFRAEFFEASRLARQHLDEALVPRALLDKVARLLADFRAEHP
jgi:TRAP-type C4-dicarboxylate transport system substrate-binding protein